MHRSGSCRGGSSLYLASRSSPATSLPANLYFKLCASLVAGAVAGVSQGAEGGRGEEGEYHVLRDMLRAVLKCDA